LVAPVGLITNHPTSDVFTSHLLTQDLGRLRQDPVQDLLHISGIGATVTLLTTGQIDDLYLNQYAIDLANRVQTPLPFNELLAHAQTIAADRGGQPGNQATLDASDWRRLQLICASGP
jgi:hypothetical protein